MQLIRRQFTLYLVTLLERQVPPSRPPPPSVSPPPPAALLDRLAPDQIDVFLRVWNSPHATCEITVDFHRPGWTPPVVNSDPRELFELSLTFCRLQELRLALVR